MCLGRVSPIFLEFLPKEGTRPGATETPVCKTQPLLCTPFTQFGWTSHPSAQIQILLCRVTPTYAAWPRSGPTSGHNEPWSGWNAILPCLKKIKEYKCEPSCRNTESVPVYTFTQESKLFSLIDKMAQNDN